jgi:hypothetical protein
VNLLFLVVPNLSKEVADIKAQLQLALMKGEALEKQLQKKRKQEKKKQTYFHPTAFFSLVLSPYFLLPQRRDRSLKS